MKEELIKKQYIRELENLIREKRLKLERLEGLEREKAVCRHLIEIDDFVLMANSLLNEIIARNQLIIRSDQQYNDFMHFITPAAQQIYRKYYQGLLF